VPQLSSATPGVDGADSVAIGLVPALSDGLGDVRSRC